MANELEPALNEYRRLGKEIGKLQSSMGQAGTQILENEMVLKVRSCCAGGVITGARAPTTRG